jgi:small subunit ribosomal protein S7
MPKGQRIGKYYKSLDHLLKPDPRYNSKLVGKFINCVMLRGKKTVAQKIVYGAFDEAQKRIREKEGIEIFQTALNNVKPVLEVRSKRIGGATYQVPIEVPPKRRTSLAMRWIIHAARKRKGKPMRLKLADELVAAYKGEGDAIATRTNVHKMAEANKAFAHFARF